ncbi:hypothetical protein AYI70_g10600, partial [Smittium culicis]
MNLEKDGSLLRLTLSRA